jgi:hypothetical protein
MSSAAFNYGLAPPQLQSQPLVPQGYVWIPPQLMVPQGAMVPVNAINFGFGNESSQAKEQFNGESRLAKVPKPYTKDELRVAASKLWERISRGDSYGADKSTIKVFVISLLGTETDNRTKNEAICEKLAKHLNKCFDGLSATFTGRDAGYGTGAIYNIQMNNARITMITKKKVPKYGGDFAQLYQDSQRLIRAHNWPAQISSLSIVRCQSIEQWLALKDKPAPKGLTVVRTEPSTSCQFGKFEFKNPGAQRNFGYGF